MSDKQTGGGSPVQRLLVEFQTARMELGKIETARNKAMGEWADMRQRLEASQPQVELTRHYEAQTTVLRELNERFIEAQQKVRQIQNAMAQGHAQWSKERSLDLSRSQPTR